MSKRSIILSLSIIFFLGTHLVHSQNVGINTTGAAPSTSAILDIVSTDQGLLIPRLTDAERQALKDPATGLMIYNTTSNELNFYNGSNWKRLPGSSVSVVSAGGAGPGGGIAINTTGAAADASAILDITSTTKGMLVPRAASCSITPVAGLTFYDSGTNQAVFYNGSRLKTLCAATIDNNKGAGAMVAGAAINSTGATGNASAILDLTSTTKGLLIPRMTSAQRDLIKTPATGLMIYNSTDSRMEYWMGTAWYTITTGTGFQTEWTTTAPAQTITLPLNSGNGSGFNCIVDWGDGSSSCITSVADADRTHIYTLAGTYTVEITGQCEGWSFNFAGDLLKIKKVLSWGDPCAFDGFKYLYRGFAGCSSLTSLGTGSILASGAGCTNFQEIFRNCSGLTSIPSGLFNYHTQVTLNGFQSTFSDCTGLTGSIPTDLFRFNTLVSTSGFYQTFYNCSGLTGAIPTDLFRYNTLVSTSGFELTFADCRELTGAIPTDLFRYNTLVSTRGFSHTFYNCRKLTSIPTDLFRYNTAVSISGFQQTFYNCYLLTGAIPTDLFRYNTAVSSTAFANTFANCIGLTGVIPTDLFRYNTLVSSNGFVGTFYSCTGLTGTIPSDLFRYNTLVGTYGFRGTFSGCTGLTGAIPTDLFRYNTLVTDLAFSSTFKGCLGLTGAIPTDLFRYNTLVLTEGFYETFYGCSGLTAIPIDLFRYNTSVSSSGFYQTFYGCIGLTSIPTDLFRYNTAVSTFGFYGTFYGCTGIIGAITTDLFKYNTAISNDGFNQTFYGCTGLTSIPTDLFRYNTAVSYNSFYKTFYNCTGLTALPTDLFRYNTAISNSGFYQTFYGCTGLTSIPTDLFRYNTAVSSEGFLETFYGCTGLPTLPTDLFRYNTAVSGSGFYQTFYGCSGLTTLPTDLFKYNTSCRDFRGTFQNCAKLQLNRNIFFADGEEATRFLNQSVNFTSCFSRTSFTGVQGEAPYLWNCSFGTGTPTKTSCFGGAGNSTTSLSNYPDELITLDVSPATDWAAGDVITGQTSGRTCTVVSKITATTYIVNARGGLGYTLGEIIGVTGVPAKLADQGAANPTFAASGWR